MRAGLPIFAALLLASVAPAAAQTINGESNYEDGFSHIPPQPDDPPGKAQPNGSGSRGGDVRKPDAASGK